MDYSMTEIAKNAGVGWTAFLALWPQLVEKEIVILTRKVGNAKLYKLNTKNPWVKELIKMDFIITKLETEKLLSKKEEISAQIYTKSAGKQEYLQIFKAFYGLTKK